MRYLATALSILLWAVSSQAATAPSEWTSGDIARSTVVIKLGEHFAVEYEHAVHPQVSVFVGPALFAAYSKTVNSIYTELGFGGTLGARFFVSGLAPEGLYVGPLVTLGYSTVRSADMTSHGLRITSGAMVGYTWIFGNVFDLSLGAGASYVNATTSAEGGTPPAPVTASLRAALGVAF